MQNSGRKISQNDYFKTQNFVVYCSIFQKLKQISVERWRAISIMAEPEAEAETEAEAKITS